MNTKRFFALLLVLALAFSMLPAHEAIASTGVCHKCGQPVDAEYVDEGNHTVKCTNPCCEYYNQTLYTGHWGGAPTCTQEAICSTCGHSYIDFNNHNWDSELSYDEYGPF